MGQSLWSVTQKHSFSFTAPVENQGLVFIFLQLCFYILLFIILSLGWTVIEAVVHLHKVGGRQLVHIHGLFYMLLLLILSLNSPWGGCALAQSRWKISCSYLQICWALDNHIWSNFWKFYLIRIGFILGELVFLVKVF